MKLAADYVIGTEKKIKKYTPHHWKPILNSEGSSEYVFTKWQNMPFNTITPVSEWWWKMGGFYS